MVDNKENLIQEIENGLIFPEDGSVEIFLAEKRKQTILFVKAIIKCFEEGLTEKDLSIIKQCQQKVIETFEDNDQRILSGNLKKMDKELEKISKEHENENQLLQERKTKFPQFDQKYSCALIQTIDFSDEQIQKLEKLMMNLKCLKGVSFSEFMQLTQLTQNIIDQWDNRLLGYIINISNKYWKWYNRPTNDEGTPLQNDFLREYLPEILKLQKTDDIAYITKEPGKEFTEKDYAMLNKYIEVFNFKPWRTAILRDILKGKGSLFSSEDMEKLYELTLSYQVLGLQTDKIKFFTVIGEFYIKHDTTFGKQEN